MAIDRVRYAGEPVAVVAARDRYVAEDALERIDVRYAPLPAVVDPEAALRPDAPLLHDGFPGNLASDRRFRYGDPDVAFAQADHRIEITVNYPRNACTPIETYGVLAEYDPAADAYDVTANFQGPFSLHAVLARALRVPGNRLRLRTPPDSGGSFGVKQGVFPYIVLVAAAARVAERPVKWVEDRLEHLAASVTRHQSRHASASGGRGGRPHPGAGLGPDRGLRRPSARARAGHAVSHARQHDRRLRHPPRGHPQPRRGDQQAADRA